ncbi:MAG: alpha/beta fold hydrolase [Pseudonocardiaceae bacterium]|nr:alpha/beta fold hydrolase [Pseudonocardiaceae bacterium]
MARSQALGVSHSLELPPGTVRYRERGSGRPVVFVHGLLVNADLWRAVVPTVAEAGYRCVAPDWPLGSHQKPMAPDADLSPPALAALIADFLAALELRDVTLVANDTGGALTQILMANHPERLGRVVLTPADSFERFLPPMFNYLPKLAAHPCSTTLLAAALRSRILQRLPVAYGWLTKKPIPGEFLDSYLGPSRHDPRIRHDLRKFLRGIHRRHTLRAAETLRRFDKPVLLAWAPEDRHFPISLAHRLAELLPDATIAEIPDSYTFVPEDQPDRLATLITEFANLAAPSAAG